MRPLATLTPRLLIAAAAVMPYRATAQQLVVRSDDGSAVLTIGGGRPAGTVRVVRIPDGDDVAGVAGAHYRIESSAGALPAGSRLTIRWDSAGVPGGVAAGDLRLMHQSGERWQSIAARDAGNRSLDGPVVAIGDFAVRWSPARGCAGDAYHALDFRIGTWDYRAPGYTPGKSVVTRDPSACAVLDHYMDLQGARSTSLFLFDAAAARWYNTTIDPGGRFVSSGVVERDGIVFYHSPVDREAYRRRDDGTIAFAAERSSDGGKTWKAWATATYTPGR